MDKERLVDEILEMELEMFLAVPSVTPAPCQQNPDGLRTFRVAQFQAWSIETLTSYRNDLVKAVSDGRNLMTLKYARMENLIRPLHGSPQTHFLIDEIVSLNVKWQRDLCSRFPLLMASSRPLDEKGKKGGGVPFATYLRGELETYSLATLTNLYRDMIDKETKGENMTEDLYACLVKSLGYSSLEDAEEQLKTNRPGGNG